MRLLLLAGLLLAQDWELKDDAAATPYKAVAERRSVETSWAGNTLYVWFLPSSKAHFSPSEAAGVARAGNAFLQRMSVMTHMVAIAAPAPFDASDLDKTDLVAMVGEKAEVLDWARKSKLLSDADFKWVDQDWQPVANNPEMGIDKYEGRKGLVIISASSARSFTKEAAGKATKEQMTALLAIHGAGHVAGLKHLNDGNFMDDGATLSANISGKSGYISAGVLVNPRLTPIDDLFHAGKFDKLPASNYDRKYAPEKTQRKAWNELFGSRAPSTPSLYCSRLPKHCL